MQAVHVCHGVASDDHQPCRPDNLLSPRDPCRGAANSHARPQGHT